jgi:transcription elongation factor GreA
VTPTYLTHEGYRKIKEELDYLIKIKRKEVAKRLEHARGMGDLRENAEYDAAKEEQAHMERRISELSEKLATSQIIDHMKIPTDKAYIGATVQLKDIDSMEKLEYILVSEAEADFLENKISVTSPIGKGLLGRKEGETVEIQVPAGIINYQILKITR